MRKRRKKKKYLNKTKQNPNHPAILICHEEGLFAGFSEPHKDTASCLLKVVPLPRPTVSLLAGCGGSSSRAPASPCASHGTAVRPGAPHSLTRQERAPCLCLLGLLVTESQDVLSWKEPTRVIPQGSSSPEAGLDQEVRH